MKNVTVRSSDETITHTPSKVGNSSARILMVPAQILNLGDFAQVQGVAGIYEQAGFQKETLFDRASSPETFPNSTIVLAHQQAIPESGLDRWKKQLSIGEVPLIWRFKTAWELVVDRTVRYTPLAHLCSNSQNLDFDKFCSRFEGLHLRGGGYLTDIFPHRIRHCRSLMNSFRKKGKPVLLTGQQIGPFKSSQQQKVVFQILRDAHFVGLRDRHSVKYCRLAGLSEDKFGVLGDDSFGFSTSPEGDVERLMSKYGVTSGQFLAVNLRLASYSGMGNKDAVEAALLLQKLAERFKLPLLIVPIALDDQDSDIVAGKLLQNHIENVDVRLIEEPISAAQTKELLSHSFGVVGGSWHFCTFALSRGVPAVLLYKGRYYQDKARGLISFWKDDRLGLDLQKAGTESKKESVFELFEDQPFRTQLCQQALQSTEYWAEATKAKVEEFLFAIEQGTSKTTISG